MKKLLSLALALLLLAVMLPVTAMADTYTYPAGVTAESFPNEADYDIPGGSTGKAAAVVAYEKDGNVKYAADVLTAINDGATVLYMKEGIKGRLMAYTDFLAQPNRTPELTKNLTIYGNGADFQYGEIAVNISETGPAAELTVIVYDAKNIKIWGNTPNAGVTQNYVLENCKNQGTSKEETSGELVFLWGETGTANVSANNCSVSNVDFGIYFGCDGSLNLKNSSFTECATGVKISHKGTGTRTDVIENCTFTDCGIKDGKLAGDSAAIKYKSTNGATLTLTNNTITGTLTKDTFGDIRLNNVTATITPNGTTTTVNTGIKDTPETITGKVTVDDKGTITHVQEEGPTTIVIISPTQDTPKTDDQKNPATGANDLVAVAVAAAALALAGSAIILRKD